MVTQHLVDEAATELFGADQAALVGSDLLSLAADPGALEDLRRALAQVQAGSTWQGDLAMRGAEGSALLAGLMQPSADLSRSSANT